MHSELLLLIHVINDLHLIYLSRPNQDHKVCHQNLKLNQSASQRDLRTLIKVMLSNELNKTLNR